MTLDWASKRENRSRIEYGNRENGPEEAYPVSVPVAAVFSRFFSYSCFFLPKWYTEGLYGIRCWSGRDFPVPFSSLVTGVVESFCDRRCLYAHGEMVH